MTQEDCKPDPAAAAIADEPLAQPPADDAGRKITNRSIARDYIARLPLSKKARAFLLALQTCTEDAIAAGDAVQTPLGFVVAPTMEEIGANIGRGLKLRATQQYATEARGTRYVVWDESDGERTLWLMLWNVVWAEVDDRERLTITADELAEAWDLAFELRERRPRPEPRPSRKRSPAPQPAGTQLTLAKTPAHEGAHGPAHEGAH